MLRWPATLRSVLATSCLACGGSTPNATDPTSDGTAITSDGSDAVPTGDLTDAPPSDTTDPTTETTLATTDASSSTGDPPIVCSTDCHYIRAGATGSGADWADALPALPDALERGHTYYIAAGSYPGYSFDDPESGDDLIRVVRASEGDHGDGLGWDPAFAGGEATFGPLVFTTGHYSFDGRRALRAVGEFEGTVVDIGASAVELRGVDVDGAFAERGGKHTAGACTGMNIAGDDVIVAGNRIHDAADDGVSIAGLGNLLFADNVVHALHGCGTDGDCGPCYNGHSDGLELYAVRDSVLARNLIYDVASTSAVFFGNWADELGMGPSEYCENILLADNILYSPETGFVAYIEDARGVLLLHNVLWGLHQGAYGGLSIGTHVEDLDLYNNAILSINYAHIGGAHDPAEHRGDHNLFAYSLGQWQDGPNDRVAADPLFAAIPGGEGPAVADPAPEDFTPQAGSPLIDAGWPGDADIELPATDFLGAPRDDTPDIGAIEH